MNDSSSSSDDRVATQISAPSSPQEEWAPAMDEDVPTLQLAIVNYEGRPDRGTIHPAGLEGLARMETWLSADMEFFVDVGAYR